MKKINIILLLLVVIISLSSCNAEKKDDIVVKTNTPTTAKVTATKTPTAEPTAEPTPKPTIDPNIKELYLTSLEYTDFYLNGTDEPFYGFIPHTGEYLEVCGVRFEKGVFINPVSGSEAGYVTYDIENLKYNRFVAKVGKLDVVHGNGDPIVFRVYLDEELIIESEEMSQGDEAYLIDIEIGEGKKELKLECSVVTADHTECSGVFGDARLCSKGEEVIWP